ncbi:MAG: hypothetical protein GC166_04100 [Alphaproteobacteria bacterium]|nr:hypothetical protein [Alphaproteobacteria bacterium]
MRSAVKTSALALALLCAASPVLAAEKQQRAEHKITQAESFIMIAPMYASVIDEGRPSGLLMVAIGLDIPDTKLREAADHAMPLLRDAYVRSLMSFAATAVRPWRQPDVVYIAERLQRVTDRMLKKKGAQVLLAQVAVNAPR